MLRSNRHFPIAVLTSMKARKERFLGGHGEDHFLEKACGGHRAVLSEARGRWPIGIERMPRLSLYSGSGTSRIAQEHSNKSENI